MTSLSLPILPLIKPYDSNPLKLQNVLALIYIRGLFIKLIKRNFQFIINKIILLLFFFLTIYTNFSSNNCGSQFSSLSRIIRYTDTMTAFFRHFIIMKIYIDFTIIRFYFSIQIFRYFRSQTGSLINPFYIIFVILSHILLHFFIHLPSSFKKTRSYFYRSFFRLTFF